MSLVENALARAKASAQAANPPARGNLPTAPRTPVHAPERQIRINREALRGAGFLPDVTHERLLNNQFRQIKRPLLAEALNGEAGAMSRRVIMVAGALPGDGKTFTSVNLALSLARERDLSVLLVDADVGKRDLSRLFGLEGARGLIDALAQTELDVNSLVVGTDVPGLSILPAGQQRDGLTELLASGRMAEICAALVARSARDIVLLDSPPLLASSESRPLLDHAGQILMVVRAGQTPRRAVASALELIPGERSANLILNRSVLPHAETYYGYGTYGTEPAAP